MEKIKHIVLAGIVIVSMVMFGVMYYMKTTDAGWENIRSFVLADSGSEDDEDEDDDEEEEEEDENESDDEKEDDEDDEDEEEEEEKKVQKESSRKESSNSGSEKSDSVSRSKNTDQTRTTRVEKIKIKEDDDDEDEDEEDEDEEDEIEDDEDKEEGEGTIVSKEVITNEDGTITRRQTLLKKDGRKKVTEHTFDANNKLVSKKKLEVRSDKGEEKVEVKTFDVYGKKIAEYKMETKDGKKIEIRRKNDLEGESKLKFNAEKRELMVKVEEGENDEAKAFLRVKADENSTKIKLTRAGIIANSNFPITVDDETGKIYVNTPFKEVELKQMPDVIVKKAKQSRELDIVDGATLENDARPSYILKGKKFEKFLGFYTVEIPSEITYDADTGEKISMNIPGLKKLLSWFSF